MNNKLLISTQISGDEVKVGLEGTIDEDSQFDKIKSLGMKKYIFDFEKIKLINSCGIREWIKYLEDIVGADVEYINCPQIIIEQVNMVHGFIKKGATIKTFIAPYFCASCDDEKKVLINADEVINLTPPVKKCMKCNTELEFDAISKQYFSFLLQGK
jgi:hypothetical protein